VAGSLPASSAERPPPCGRGAVLERHAADGVIQLRQVEVTYPGIAESRDQADVKRRRCAAPGPGPLRGGFASLDPATAPKGSAPARRTDKKSSQAAAQSPMRNLVGGATKNTVGDKLHTHSYDKDGSGIRAKECFIDLILRGTSQCSRTLPNWLCGAQRLAQRPVQPALGAASRQNRTNDTARQG
jgi:hypothetical protein